MWHRLLQGNSHRGQGSSGGVIIVLQELTERWIVESTLFHGPNIVSDELVYGDHITLLIRRYLPPSTLDHLPDLEDALNRFLGRDIVVLGDLNADIGRLRKSRDQ